MGQQTMKCFKFEEKNQEMHVKQSLWTLRPRLHERFFACDCDAIFLKIVASPARGENRMCSHPRTGDVTDEKIAGKNREKFNELNFL